MKFWHGIPIQRRKQKWYIGEIEYGFDTLVEVKQTIDEILEHEK